MGGPVCNGEILRKTADVVISSRPLQNVSIDQYFMDAQSMVVQASNYFEYLENKDVIFIGDGDGAASHFELLCEEKIFEPMKSAVLLDIDERILNYHRRIQAEYLKASVLESAQYNVIDPLPEEFRNRFEFFYINPPYGSANAGASTIAWLHRCISACRRKCQGCIIIPDDENFPWSVRAYENVLSFLEKKNFRAVRESRNIHTYDDKGKNSGIRSTTLVVESEDSVSSEYEDTELPDSMVKNLYGEHTAIPKRIRDDGSDYGESE